MMWNEEAERAFRIASLTGHCLIVQTQLKLNTQPGNNRKSPQTSITPKHMSYLQVSESGIRCQHKNQTVSYKNLCYQLLTKFSSGNPGSILTHGKNQVVQGGTLYLDRITFLPWSQSPSTSCMVPAETSVCDQLDYQRAMTCVIQVQLLIHFELCLLEITAKKD